ncbi:hypothetical protein WJ0W_003305 [Paenibacillus melissococcoides]|uniref:Uncharacterized protein n=1 Tax=Paenibacillus melissococcoides TaxID=2912268 RepID=A0ABN8U9D2_9BACL|nr:MULTISPECIES: hypothetical protein [Paenibacillus]MEB9893259.1 hypothetical protein [Bacillus cereus]CAH8246068.1 hypothetical protein WJ0W_003305 [Paenibacillus melissococcoides]CAH8712880.1 hypothetical protein WDD9_003384 [Paenibacillus melissococcoides]CAH8713645.1 hypothetical protein HTL2_003687 [Paenibacillus melissococcoides]GIO78736.1 hypothetical protein J6TS7_23460 [Paenibacillus dendritiformis]
MNRYRFTYLEDGRFAGVVLADDFYEALKKFGEANYLTEPFSDDGNPDEGQTAKVEYIDADGFGVGYRVRIVE